MTEICSNLYQKNRKGAGSVYSNDRLCGRYVKCVDGTLFFDVLHQVMPEEAVKLFSCNHVCARLVALNDEGEQFRRVWNALVKICTKYDLNCTTWAPVIYCKAFPKVSDLLENAITTCTNQSGVDEVCKKFSGNAEKVLLNTYHDDKQNSRQYT